MQLGSRQRCQGTFLLGEEEWVKCWGKASLGLPRLEEAWIPCWPLREAPEQTQGGAGEGWAVPGRHRGRGKTQAAKGSFHESAKGSAKEVNE